MVLIVTPRSGWFRRVLVFRLDGGTEADMLEAFLAVNEMFDDAGKRDEVNITMQLLTPEQTDGWIIENTDLNWVERLFHRIRVVQYDMVRSS